MTLTYRDIEVVADATAGEGPVLIVSNHFGGVADAVLLTYLCPRFPRIVARDVIWRVPGVGRLMRAVGAIPVHKASDAGDGRSVNDAMFASCYDALREGSAVLIFPEGVTQDDPFLAPVKTGAARIALGAHARGAHGLMVQPVGIHYEDKAAFRSRVLVAFGEPFALEEFLARVPGRGEVGADDRPTVDALTEHISVALRSCAPDYRSWDEARDLQLAARVTLRSVGTAAGLKAPPLALTEVIAGHLATRPDESRRRVRDAAQRYRSSLEGLGMSDYQLAGGLSTPRLVGRIVLDAVLGLVLLPYAALGAAFGLVPYLLTRATRLVPAAPAVLATVMPVVALLVFLLEWVSAAALVGSRGGWERGVVAALLIPAFVGSTVLVSERALLLGRAVRRWAAARRRGQPVLLARQDRAALVDVVKGAL